MAESPPIRSWLYAPGNVPRFLSRVFDAGADAVALDLEDAVPAHEKDRARRLVADALRGRAQPSAAGPSRSSRDRRSLAFVRVNGAASKELQADLAAVVGPGLDGIRVPKVESRADVTTVDDAVTAAERRAGLPAGALPLVCGIESAAGVEHALEIASASSRVLSLAFGVGDFQADVGAREGSDRLETLMARSRLVTASRSAGISAPVDSVHVSIDDLDGLERTTRQGRDLGYFGRAAIHPRQVPIINAVYTPAREEIAQARHLVAAAERGASRGAGSLRLADGTFVDEAIVRRARLLVRLAEAIGTTAEGAK